MEYATLGNTGLLVSKLCFGTMTFGDGRVLFKATSAVGQPGADELVKTSIDGGINLFDKADNIALLELQPRAALDGFLGGGAEGRKAGLQVIERIALNHDNPLHGVPDAVIGTRALNERTCASLPHTS